MGLCVCALRLIECCVAEHVAYIVVCYSDTWSDDDREGATAAAARENAALNMSRKVRKPFGRMAENSFIFWVICHRVCGV